MISSIYISVVSPVYESEQVIDELIQKLRVSLSAITEQFEIILVEDGSLDRSWGKIEENCRRDSRVKGIKLSRNFGQHYAITAGLDAALGQWIVVMDCDLQDRPEEIIALHRKALEGYDIVLAKRVERRDSFCKRFFSKQFYRFLSYLSGTRYDCSIANFGIYHKKVISSVLRMQETIRYFPAMLNWVGFKSIGIPVVHAQRTIGKSAYNFRKQFKLAVDILLAYSDKPLRLIVGLGATISLVAFIFAFIIVYRYIKGDISVLGYASIITAVCFFSGVIVSVLGVVGLYVGKVFEGIKKRPSYLIEEKIN
jgi:dolichol-phosphate mannosyltransferase